MNTVSIEKSRKTAVLSVRTISMTAMLSAVAYLLAFVEFPVPLSPSFARMDLSDLLAPAPYKVKKEVPKLDEQGKPVMDKDGKPLTEVQETQVPAFKIVSVFAHGFTPFIFIGVWGFPQQAKSPARQGGRVRDLSEVWLHFLCLLRYSVSSFSPRSS